MTVATETTRTAGDIEYVTFHVGDILMGIDIHQVEEINRHIDVTAVPNAPDFVRGVINLRGEVVTVVDLRTILGLPPAEIGQQARIVVVRSEDERIGLLIDKIGDVIKTRSDEIESPPANLGGLDGRFFKGVYKLETELLVALDAEAALVLDAQTA